MSVTIFCNVCFCEPHKPTPQFSLTSCGHVICEICLQKGKKDECLICRTPCRTLVLSKQTSPDIQSLFMGIDTLCKKYSKEIMQPVVVYDPHLDPRSAYTPPDSVPNNYFLINKISEFQEKHRKHLLAYQRQKTLKLEESLQKVTQQIQQLQRMKTPEQTAQLPFSSTSRNPFSNPSRKQNEYPSYSLHSSHASTSDIFQPMEIDPIPSPMRKPETPTGPTRLSLITPPQDGRMGSISYRSSQSSGITSSQYSGAGSTRSTPIRQPHSGCSLTSTSGSQSSRMGTWGISDLRTPHLYSFPSPSPQPSATRHPITISGLLQRQHLGSTNF